MKSKGGGDAQIFWKRQETAKWSWDLKSSVRGAGNIPHFLISPTRKVSNPRLHLTVSCRFRNSSGIKIFEEREEISLKSS